jgi:uncharacterized protein
MIMTDTITARPGSRAPARRFGQFAVLCLCLSWLPWAVISFAGVDIGKGAGQIAFGLAASGPSLAALLLWLRLPTERIRGTGRPTWYGLVVGLVVGVAAPIATAIILNANHLSTISANAVATASTVGGPLGVLAYTLLAGPLSEEFGWRGYLQPRLRQRFPVLATTLVLGLSWGAWHLPLFLMPGTGQHQIGLFSVGAIAFFVSIIALTYIMLFVTERLRGGVWAAVAVHAGFNGADALMPSHGGTGAMLEMTIMIGIAAGVAVIWKLLGPAQARDSSQAS